MDRSRSTPISPRDARAPRGASANTSRLSPIANSRRERQAMRITGIDTVRHALSRPAGICKATEGKREWDSPSAMLKPCARVLAFPAVYRLATDTLVSPSPARLSLSPSTLSRPSSSVRDGLGRKITLRKNSHPRPSRFSTSNRQRFSLLLVYFFFVNY